MGSIRVRKSGYLFFDFRYRGVRCREVTRLRDTKANRRRMERVLRKIEAEITLGTFDYAAYFPKSPLATRLQQEAEKDVSASSPAEAGGTPTFRDFAETWLRRRTARTAMGGCTTGSDGQP
jgi:integrase